MLGNTEQWKTRPAQKLESKFRKLSTRYFTMVLSKELRQRTAYVTEPPPAAHNQESSRPSTKSLTETFLVRYPSACINVPSLPPTYKHFSTSFISKIYQKMQENP